MKKKSLFLIVLFSFIPVLIISAQDVITVKIEDPDPDRPHVAMSITETELIPVTVSVEDDELTLFFDDAVGNAGITIRDIDGNVMSYSIVDTSLQPEIIISLETYTAGEYILQIEYGDTTLTGEFSL